MQQIEIYLNGEPGGYHTMILVTGHQREKHDFTSQVPEQMYAKALELIDAGGHEQNVRIFDPSRKICRSGEMRVSLKNLRIWAIPRTATV